jgi:CHAD domain-containing protein
LAYKRLPNPGLGSLSERMLHACRIEAKRARYLAELAPESEASKLFIGELKRTQDAIGEWHDILKLTAKAQRLFGGVHESTLVAALQNISRARFRIAVSVLSSAVSALSQRDEASSETPLRKAIGTLVERAAVA